MKKIYIVIERRKIEHGYWEEAIIAYEDEQMAENYIETLLDKTSNRRYYISHLSLISKEEK